MSNTPKPPKVLVIEDEREWQREITSILNHRCPCEIVLLSSYAKADQFVTTQKLDDFDAVVIDVRLRQQIYDQGGLTILDLIKRRRRDMPVLVLTAYSYDYPGLTGVTQRYIRVLTYDKETFRSEPEKILDILLAELPPEIGAHDAPSPTKRSAQQQSSHVEAGGRDPFRELLIGSLVVVFILAVLVLFCLISNRFPGHVAYLNVIFTVLVVTLICVLLRIFNPDIVTQAVQLYKTLTASQDTKDRVDRPKERKATRKPNKGVDRDNK